MKWKEILLKALNYVKKYRALWYLGILAALTESAGFSGNFSGLKNPSGNSGSLSDSAQSSVDRVFNWAANNHPQVGIMLFAGFLVWLIILYISYSSRAGLIHSIDKAESGDKKPEFHDAFHSGQKYFWRFLGLTLLVALMVFAVVFVLVGLIAFFILLVAAVSLWFLLLALPIGLLVILGIIILVAYLNILLQLASREIVIKDKRIVVAIREAREVIHHHFSDVILAWLIQAVVGVVAGIATALVSLIVGGALFGIGVGVYFAGGTIATIIFASVAAIIFIALILLLGGIINAYLSTYWTLVYTKLKT